MPSVFDFIDNAKFFAFFNKSFNKSLCALIFAGPSLIVCCHYLPANFFQMPGFTPSAAKLTPGSFGAMPSSGRDPCGDAVFDLRSVKGWVPANRSTPL